MSGTGEALVKQRTAGALLRLIRGLLRPLGRDFFVGDVGDKKGIRSDDTFC